MSKFNKFLKNPGIFFRDYFIKKYPLSLDEQCHNFLNEKILIENDLRLYDIVVNQSNEPVDVVITWVNNQDPDWITKFEYYRNKKINIDLISIDNARFEDHGELFYVIKSIELHMKWVRNIFLITDDQIPTFRLSEKVKIISHSQIIDKKYLPTFNSHVIEAHLHNISELSENFIYFNDDVFVARNLPKTHFLSGNNLSSLFVTEKDLNILLKKGFKTPTLSASLNCRELLLKKYNKKVNNPLVHTYVSLKKSYFKLAWSYFNQEISNFIENKFRDNNDLNLATFLVPWMMYIEGKSKLSRDICYYFNIRSANAKTNYAFLHKKLNPMPHSFCANDFFINKNNDPNYKSNLMEFLKKFYS
ncbi:Stealth CR1 domain-containing protein [Gilliamella sp. B2824]|uniref:stealth family protein n=1 Tax=Gilliamella sp. B2824 TaxID=2818019 RepID=UPI00226A6D21|nr:stealth family protein [Gilliamella sp. B2824]MCX8738879.1 Stealth CR1 domain-containing protein [Gilliamella sp. B2824]